ncbi:DoxX family protein [Nocardia sp. NPDC051030]|uniref:DoxX family protein n=1 Tax=Nocardia sp. NPDC051030 TaxID=3155162 RepID=UPI0034455D2B
MTENATAAPTSALGSQVNATASDIGLLALRVGFGGLLAVHGTQKLFGWFNGYGWTATTAGFEQMGYNPGKVFGTLAGLSELTGGVLLLLGLFTPLAAAIALGTMLNAVNATWHGGLAAWEPAALFGILAAGLAFAGPGRFSLDAGQPWQRQGIVWGAGAVALAVVAALITLVFKWAL